MPVREFELFHGAVLTKLVRADHPLTLRMIETRPSDAWSTYRINDQVNVLIKHSLNPRSLTREKGKAWQFVFSPEQMRQIRIPSTWGALVCGGKTVGGSEMEVCLLAPEQLAELLDVSSNEPQSVTVKRIEGKGLRAQSPLMKNDLVVPRNRIDTWVVPGS
jgi:hypothetical protein